MTPLRNAIHEQATAQSALSVHQAARSWLGYLCSGDATQSDVDRFDAWRLGDGSRENAVRRAVELPRLLAIDKALSSRTYLQTNGTGTVLLILVADNEPHFSMHVDGTAAWNAVVAFVNANWSDIAPDEALPEDVDARVKIYFDRPTFYFFAGRREIDWWSDEMQ